MTTPSINYKDAIQAFLNVHDKDTYITHSLNATKDKKESAPLQEISALAKLAIEGLRQQIQEKRVSYDNLIEQTHAIRDYLVHVKNSPAVRDTHQIFQELFAEIEFEIKELASIEKFIDEEVDAKTFSDDELNKIALEQNFYLFLQKYGIKSQETKIRLAKLAAQHINVFISYDIHQLGIKSQEALVDIAKLAAQSDPMYTNIFIENYGIKDQKSLIEIAKVAAQHNGGTTSRFIGEYGITDQGALIEIAKLAAQHHGEGLSMYIQNYGIKNQIELIEIAKLSAQQNGEQTSKLIQNYGINIDNQKALIEIAKLAAKQNGGGTSECIQNYAINIDNQKALIEIAELAVQCRTESLVGGYASKYLQNYGINIDNQEALINLAKLAAKKHGAETTRWIKNYGIDNDNQEALIEIAKLAAKQSGLGTSHNIQNYGIRSQEALIEIAKLAAQENGEAVSINIRFYGIKNQDALIEIAKLAAKQNGKGTSEFIQNYGIEEESILIEIAKLAVQQSVMSEYIHNYNIKNQDALIEIAKLAAKQNGEGVSQYIENYGITDQNSLIEIAKLAVRQDAMETSRLIKNYGITKQSALVEIAKLGAQHAGGISYSFQNYGIKREADRQEIFFIAFKNYPKGTLSFIKNFNLTFTEEVQVLTENSFLNDIKRTLRLPEEFTPMFEVFTKEDATKEDKLFLIYLGLKFLQKPSYLKDPNLWVSIVKYKDNKMRYELAELVFALDEKQAKIYSEVSSPNYLQLPALLYCSSSTNDEIIKSYHDILKDKREFRDGMMQKALLDALHPLIVSHHFEPDEVKNLLKKAFIGNLKTNLFSIQGILACGGEDFLRKEAQNEKPDLGAAYQAVLHEQFPLSL